MTRSVRTCRLALILAGAVASILATAVLTCALLPSLSAEANVVATNPSPASVARGPIPGFGPCSTYAVHYGHLNGAMLARLKKFDLVILHPGSDITSTQVDELQAAGVIVLGYVSIGEEPPDAVPTVGDGCGPAYYAPGETCSVPGKTCCEVKDRHCEGAGVASYYLDEDRDCLPDVHGPWGSYYVDPANPYWRDRIRHCDKDADTSCSFYGTDYVINTLGCDGLFLDTVDTASPWHPYYYTLDSMTETICTLSDLYPAKYIVINRGIFFAAPEYGADEVRPCINGIVFENYYSEWYWEGDEGRISPWFPDNRDVWAPKLITQANMPDGYALFALDYLSPSQHVSIAHQINETAVRWGWIDYISTPSLDTIRWEAWEHIHRLVNTTDDELNSDGDCSLREAIQAANTDAAVDVCVTGTNGDIINLPTGTYTLTLGGAGEDANLTGDLDITDTHALVIIGAGSDKTVINANGIDRVFDIRPGAGTVVIKGVTILNGSVTNDNGGGTYDADADLILINTTISGNTATGSWPYAKGGGVYVSSGSVTLSGGQIKNNFAGQGGGVFVEQGRAMLSGGQIVNNTVSGNGGGMYIYQGRAMVSRGQIISNTADFYGGGVYNAGMLMLDHCTVNGSTTGNGSDAGPFWPSVAGGGGDGGGIYNSGTLTMTNSAIRSNTTGHGGSGNGDLESWGGPGGDGGGIHNAGTLTLDRSAVSGNTAGYGGDANGWSPAGPGGDGGGIYNAGTMTFDHSTVSGNTAGNGGNASTFSPGGLGGDGGGIFVDGGTLSLINSTVISNQTSNGGGGGVYIYQGRAMVSRGQIISNTAGFYGGGVYIAGTANTLFLTNTVIADNQANAAGSGLHVVSSSPHLVHTTIARNNGGDGSGVYVRGTGSNVALTNTILVSHTVGITVAAGNTAILNGVLWYSNAVNYGGGGAIIVTNEYTGNPAFATDGYHLSRASAAIDKGVNAGVKTDIDGQSRPVGWPDIGADEWGMWVYLPLVMRQFQLHAAGH